MSAIICNNELVVMLKKKNRHIVNLISGLLCQGFTAVSGLILPSLIIKTYGSVLNGLVSTATQLVTYLCLAEAGLASASLVSLFKPLAEKDYNSVSSIMAAVNKFYIRVSHIILAGSILCGILIQIFNKDDIPQLTIWLVTFSIALTSYISFRFLNKYRLLFQADNMIFVVNIIHSAGVALQFTASLFLIHNKIDISSTRCIVAVTNIIEGALLYFFSRIIFPKINLKAIPAPDAIKQRKDVVVHQILALVLNNTDMVLLYLFSPSASSASVYSVYAMIGVLIHNALNSVISMFSAKMGQSYAVGDYENVRRILKKYEVIYNIAMYTFYCSMAILILPFVSVYTKGVNDAEYYDPTVAILFSIYGITRMLRLPYSELTSNAGRFKETKNQAIIEASMNLIVSVILLPFLGIPGVLIGSISGEIYRTIHTYYYCEKEIMHIDWIRSILFVLVNCGFVTILIQLFEKCRFMIMDSYIHFFILASVVTVSVFVIIGTVNCFSAYFYHKVRGHICQ